MLAKRHNIDLSAFFDGVRNSAGNSYVFETEVPLIYNGTYDPGFTIDLHCKVKVIHYFMLFSSMSPPIGDSNIQRFCCIMISERI